MEQTPAEPEGGNTLQIRHIPAPAVAQLPRVSDDRSAAEAQSLAAGTLEQDAAKNKHKRDEDFRNHVSWARKAIFWFLIVSFILMTAALVIHWVTPWCFLEQRQLDTIKTIIGAALASKVFTEQSRHMN